MDGGKEGNVFYHLNSGIWVLKSQRPRLEYSLYHLLLCDFVQVAYLISFCLRFFISKLELIKNFRGLADKKIITSIMMLKLIYN